MADKTQVHTVYKLANGQRVPSVTTYLGILGKPAVIHWAWECGVQGLDYRKVRDQAGDIGTLVHYLILCSLGGKEPDLSAYSPQDLSAAEIPMSKFRAWLTGKVIEPILMEQPLVSETYAFGGTPDFFGLVNGVRTLLDFKTSGAVYPENFYQLAAYKHLLYEGGYYPVDQIKIIRIGKAVDDGLEERTIGNIEDAFTIFLACRDIYELQREMRKAKTTE
mgnify:CR=1 FL=1